MSKMQCWEKTFAGKLTKNSGKLFEKNCRKIIESKLENTPCGFRLGRSTNDQIFALNKILDKSWEYAKDVYTCFVGIEKA